MIGPDDLLDKYRGAMIGAAIGDAYGRPTEFRREFNAGLERASFPDPALVTDDTQMSLAVAEAISRPTPNPVSPFRREFVRWVEDGPHEGRAPGRACLAGAHRLRDSTPAAWHHAADLNAQGSGAVMRAHPVAFASQPQDVSHLAALQASLTHGHPAAIAATAAWAQLVRGAASGNTPDQWGDAVRLHLTRTPLSHLVLPVAERADTAPDDWWASGVAIAHTALDPLAAALAAWDRHSDPCLLTGDGWTSPEAVATSVLIAVAFASTPPAAVERAARTCGDSDTIASMVGALLGAFHGTSVWPRAWVAVLESRYREQVTQAWLPRIKLPTPETTV